jgi:hypothetical protein
VSFFLFFVSILLIPVSSLLDGRREERRRVIRDFFPNLAALAINTVSYYYANVVGLLRCRNQSVWVKTEHKVTTLEGEKSDEKN